MSGTEIESLTHQAETEVLSIETQSATLEGLRMVGGEERIIEEGGSPAQ